MYVTRHVMMIKTTKSKPFDDVLEENYQGKMKNAKYVGQSHACRVACENNARDYLNYYYLLTQPCRSIL